MANLVELFDNFPDPFSADLRVLEFKEMLWQPKRIYLLNNFVPGTTRGNHAHKNLSQLLFVISGQIDVEVFKGKSKKRYTLKPGNLALYIFPGEWRVLLNSTSETNLLVLADAPYDESDYIREWDEYLTWYRKLHEHD